jgi:ParB-like chromosome segregation protein Spo0J
MISLQEDWRAVLQIGVSLPRLLPKGVGGAIFAGARVLWWIDSLVGGEVIMETGHLREIKEIEIAQLNLRYASTRIDRLKERLVLAASIERVGQIVPVIVSGAMVLLDGYLRVKALIHCGCDTVRAEIWDCTEEEALVEILARAHGRKWDLLEEAALVRELHDHCNLSQGRIAAMVGRTQGWVSGRLALYSALSEDLMDLIRKGSISTWAATRVIVPIARAIPEHGKALSENLSKVSLSTREMARFLCHYQKANRRQRENMVHEPALFVKTLRARQEAREAKTLKEGPEGAWVRDLGVIAHMLTRLIKEVPILFSSCRSNLDRRVLLTAFEESTQRFTELESQIRRYDDHQREPAGDHVLTRAGSPYPADQPDPESIPEHRQAGDQGGVAGHSATAIFL